MIGLSLLPLIALLPSIHYGDIVDEHRDKHKYNPVSNWKPYTPSRIVMILKYKLYGAWMFNNHIYDRLSLILMHAISVLLIEIHFGLLPAILYSTLPATLFLGVWRNGRRYVLGNIVCVLMAMLGPIGLLLYPLLYFAHVGSLVAGAMFLFTNNWVYALIGVSLVALCAKFNRWRYIKRSKTQPRFLYIFHRSKVILFFKTMAYFVYRTLVPHKVFMYESWFQHYGVDKDSTKGFFKKDWWFYGGIGIFVFLLSLLWFEKTRFAAGWFIVFFIPFSNFVTNHQHNNLRYSVLPSIGLFSALTTILPWYCFMPTIIGNMWCMLLSMRQFQNDTDLYNYHFQHSPESIAPYFIVGQHCVINNDAQQAEKIAQLGLKQSPDHYGLHIILAHLKTSYRENILQRMEELKKFQIFKRKKQLNDFIRQLRNMK